MAPWRMQQGHIWKRINPCAATLWISDLEYTDFMKIGKPKLSERKTRRSGLLVTPTKIWDRPAP